MAARAVVYCRVSTKDQTQNLSLATQRQRCVECCDRHGFEVDRVFIEQGESAKTTDRPQFLKLLDHCRKAKGRVQYVVVYSVSRFARNSHDHLVVKAHLLGLGVSLRSVTEPIDDSSTGKLMENVLAAFAQFDNDVRSERTVVGMKAAIERGRWTFHPPLGYQAVRGADDAASLAPESRTAPLLRRAFELYATGLHTKTEVLRIVTALGLRTRQGKQMSVQALDNALRNPLSMLVGSTYLAGT